MHAALDDGVGGRKRMSRPVGASRWASARIERPVDIRGRFWRAHDRTSRPDRQDVCLAGIVTRARARAMAGRKDVKPMRIAPVLLS
jgi:hypothetical protein